MTPFENSNSDRQ